MKEDGWRVMYVPVDEEGNELTEEHLFADKATPAFFVHEEHGIVPVKRVVDDWVRFLNSRQGECDEQNV
jgi:hypothetical protein